jgi:molybdenum cofactor cytidylyltransferase
MISGAQTLHIVVLAAGASNRFGSPKQLARIDDVPMLRLVVCRALDVAGRLVSVVVGAHGAEVSATLHDLPVQLVTNNDWAEGMASSLRAGIRQLPASCTAALVLLGDQPGVTSDDLQRLVAAWQRSQCAITAAFYEDRLGAPAIFARSQFPALLALQGDQGARAVLRGAAQAIERVPMPNAARDVDTPADLH